jgi:hypothetical protein
VAVKDWAQSDSGRRILKGLRRSLTVGVFGYLIYQMTEIGWGRIWADLPTTPWFYIIFLALYFLLPVFQSLAYTLIWGLPFRRLFPPLLKTGVYNKEVLNYSGEVYLFSWARTHVARTSRAVAHHIKDNTIVSSVASTLNAALLLAFFLLTGTITLSFLGANSLLYLAGGALGAVLLGAAVLRFRQAVFALSGRLLLALLGLYLLRLFLLQGLQVTQWAVVIPSVPLETWFTFLAVQIILNRIPLLPSQDLLFMAVGLEMAGAAQVPEAPLAGALAVHSVLDKGLGLLLFAVVSWRDRTLGAALTASPSVSEASGDGRADVAEASGDGRADVAEAAIDTPREADADEVPSAAGPDAPS